jgi:hypothetical protein
MSNLQRLLIAAKQGLEPWEKIPAAQWPAIAAQCGPDEIQEIHDRLTTLQAELETIDKWDGDTCDDIHQAIAFFKALLLLINK